MSDIWILGATGRTGRAIAALLVAKGLSPLLIGRDASRLRKATDSIGGTAPIEVMGSLQAIASAISERRPLVVVNTIGPFTHTAMTIAGACPPGTHYVDLSNELPSVVALLGLHDNAVVAGSTFVTGGGFGVLGTESVVLKLCEGQPKASSVRCAAIPAVESEPGPLGEALAASITEGFVFGGRHYEKGKLTRAPLLAAFEKIQLPDGRVVGTASAPSGELKAAQRASSAPSVIAATSLVPASRLLRIMLPAMLSIMKITALRNFARHRIAAIEVKPVKVKVAQISWSYARVEWPSGVISQGWLRTGDAMVFTASVMAHIVVRLSANDAPPGAYTPGALFGSEFAEECGGQFIIDGPRHKSGSAPLALKNYQLK